MLRLLVCLNLLNAFVKLPEGPEVVSYAFIKGYAGKLFQHITTHGERYEHIAVFYDSKGDIAYFRIAGIQVSFHHIIFEDGFRSHYLLTTHRAQQWDGLRLQSIAEELFDLVCSDLIEHEAAEIPEEIREKFFCLPERQPIAPRVFRPTKSRARWPDVRGWSFGVQTLQHALRFNVWHCHRFTLYRREGNKRTRVIRFDGRNAKPLNAYLREHAPWIAARHAGTLMVGRHYHVSPQLHVRVVTPSMYHRLLAQNHYRLRGGVCRNLCITYGIALYLAERFPNLRFINTLNCNRERVRTVFYNHARLLRVPPDSPRRKLKIWLPIDKQWQLRRFCAKELPTHLIEEYLAAPEDVPDFRIVRTEEGVGLKAYERFHLLPCVFTKIRLHHNFAYVERPDGKHAVYALREETFRTDFIFDSFHYDSTHFTGFGSVNGKDTVLFRLHPEKTPLPDSPHNSNTSTSNSTSYN